MSHKDMFAATVVARLDFDSFRVEAERLHATMPDDMRGDPESLGISLAMAAAQAAAKEAYDILSPNIDKIADGLGLAIVALRDASDKASGIAIELHHDGLPELIDQLVDASKPLTELANEAWNVVLRLQSDRIASVCGLGRKVVTGESDFSPASVRELSDIATQMAKDGQAHPIMIFLHGGGESLTISQLHDMAEAGTFPVSGYPHPGPLECERFVAWAKSRMEFASLQVSKARNTYGYPTSAAIARAVSDPQEVV